MKIALVIERMDVSRGGRERSTAQVAVALAARGHEVTVLCQQGLPFAEPGITVEALGRRGFTQTHRLWNFVRDVRRSVSGGRFDIVHAMLPIPFVDIYQPRGGTVEAQVKSSWQRRRGFMRLAALLVEPMNYRRRLTAWLEKRVMADTSILCLGVSDMITREFSEYYGRTENVRTVYNAVDVPKVSDVQRATWRGELRAKIGATNEDTVFVTIAGNYTLKGVEELINAYADWRASDAGAKAFLVVIGQGQAPRFTALADSRNVGSSVVFLPHTPEVFPWYSAADACVLLSWYDPCSRVILEACRWGLPCVTTQANGAGEILADGAGFVVSSPRDRAGIALAMADLADPARRAKRVEACAQLADKLSIERHVNELLAAYESVISRRGTR